MRTKANARWLCRCCRAPSRGRVGLPAPISSPRRCRSGWGDRGEGGGGGRTDTGQVQEQQIALEGLARSWRCIELTLDAPTEDGETTIRLGTNLPLSVSAAQVAELYRRRWRIEGMFQRLESV